LLQSDGVGCVALLLLENCELKFVKPHTVCARGSLRPEEIRRKVVRRSTTRTGKLPETPNEWREKVSPVILFSRFIAKSRSAFSKSRVIFKKPTGAKKAESFSKSRRRLFDAKNRQMSQL
jgi:hypothetical protein